MNDPQNLISWLKYLDVEFLDHKLCIELSKLDINNPDDQKVIIRTAIQPEYEALNETSKKAMELILVESEDQSEIDVIKVFERVGMPFQNELVDCKAFLRRIRVILFSTTCNHELTYDDDDF